MAFRYSTLSDRVLYLHYCQLRKVDKSFENPLAMKLADEAFAPSISALGRGLYVLWRGTESWPSLPSLRYHAQG